MKAASGRFGPENTMKKYKLKTHKATAKRVDVTGSGKYRHLPAARTKYHRKKDAERNRELNRLEPMAEGDAKKMKVLLPYGK
jgi:large subunit ribosomal protein L35